MEPIVVAYKTRIDSASNYFQLLNVKLFLSLQEKLNEPIAKRKFLGDLQSSLSPRMETPMLKLNIGGKKYDIQRDVITSNPIGWNLLACLFEPRWDKYLFKDKHGRIYLDMESEGLLALLDQFQELKSKIDSGGAWNEALNKLSLRQPSHAVLSQYLQLLELFHCQHIGKKRIIENIQGLWLTALDTFKRRGVIKSLYNLFSLRLSGCSGKIFSLQLLHCNKAGSKVNGVFNFKEKEGRNLVVFAEDKDGNVYGGVTKSGGASIFKYAVKPSTWEWINSAHSNSTHGIKFSTNSHNGTVLSIDSLNANNLYGLESYPSNSSFKWDTLEIYSYTFEPLKPQVGQSLGPPLSTEELAVQLENMYGKKRVKLEETNTIQDMKSQCMGEFDMLINLEKDMAATTEYVNEEKRLFLRELLFVERYLFQQKHSIAGTFTAALDNSIDESKLRFERMTKKLKRSKTETETVEGEEVEDEELLDEEMLEEEPCEDINSPSMFIDDQINRVCESIVMNNPTPLEEPNTTTESTTMKQDDPILYFNVNGERVCLFKASLLKVFPDCQLAVRASGKWTMQPNEVDEEGNWYIKHVNTRLFRKLMEFIRMKGREKLESRYTLVVEEDEEEDMRHMLDYLNISNVDIQIKP